VGRQLHTDYTVPLQYYTVRRLYTLGSSSGLVMGGPPFPPSPSTTVVMLSWGLGRECEGAKPHTQTTNCHQPQSG
jgi:hypothetical protein